MARRRGGSDRRAPRERSGPIGISSGDFATPVVRKRTTTQPRGVPVLGARVPAPSLDEPVTAAPTRRAVDFEDQVTPAPEPAPPALEAAPGPLGDVRAATGTGAVPAMEPTPAPEPMREPEPSVSSVVGAMPAAAVEAIPVAMPTRPPPPPVGDDDPFAGGAPARFDIDAEAAALAAEAAAVRALDSGPLTPPPEVVSAPQTPPTEIVPETPTPPPEIEAAPLTPPPDILVTRTPPPELAAEPNTPPPDVAATHTPASEVAALSMQAPDITVIRTPPARAGGGHADPRP